MATSLFAQLCTLLAKVRGADGDILTTEFLSACQEFVHVIEKFGTAFYIVKVDVGGNIDRLRTAQEKNAEKYKELFSIITDEVARGEQKGKSSDTNGLLWLKRALEFTNALLLRLYQDREVSLSTAASETYTATLYQYHTWYTSAAFTVALKLVPSRETFFEKFGNPGEDLMTDMKRFVDAFGPILAQVQQFMSSHNLDFPDRV